MPQEPIKIKVADETSGSYSARRPSRTAAPTWILLGSLTACIVAALAFYGLTRRSEPLAPAAAPPPPNAEEQVLAVAAPAAPREILAPDDGALLWASPTSGPPISLAYVPDGAQLLLHTRPALLAEHPEGEKIVDSLGPWGRQAIAEVRRAAGAEIAEMESLMIGAVILAEGQLGAAYRVELAEPWEDEELVRRFPDSRAAEYSEQSLRRTGERCCFLPQQHNGRLLIVCPADLADQLIKSRGATPTLIRDLERLIAESDADRSATLLFAPKFLEAGGAQLLVHAAERLRDALDWLTRREATALMLSAHWMDDFFLELRATPQLQVSPRRFALQLRQRIEESSERMEDQILAVSWHPYGRKVLARFPSMLRKLARYTRIAEEERLAVLRCYLPAVAGHNLLLASELLITQLPYADQAARPDSKQRQIAGPQTLDERLAGVISLSFTKETLEQALELVAADIGVPIEIRGRDLQLQGITKNQSFGIDLRDRPAAEILLEILLKANPDRTAAGPADALQKLVYVIERGDAKGDRIIVTTRTAAAGRGEKLPPVFRQPEQ